MALHKILKIVALLLSLVGIYFFVTIFLKGDEVVEATGAGVDGYLYVAYVTLAVVIAFVLFFVLKGVFSGNIKRTLLSVGLFVVIAVIAYALAGSSIEGLPMVDNKPITESTSKWVGAGLNALYIFGALAIGAMIVSGIKKVTNR